VYQKYPVAIFAPSVTNTSTATFLRAVCQFKVVDTTKQHVYVKLCVNTGKQLLKHAALQTECGDEA
jgi:hypothetical protein